MSPEARFAEIEALVTDLEFRIPLAIYQADQDEIAELAGAEPLYERLLQSIEDRDLYFSHEPTRDEFSLTLDRVELDRPDCVVAAVTEDPTPFLRDGVVEQLVIVLWPVPSAKYGWRVIEIWGGGTPESVWIADCDLQNRDWRP